MADSWRSTFRVLGAALAVVRFSSPTVAWALGTEVHHPLLRSTDGGLHWADVARPAAQGVFTRVEVLGDLVVWILQYPMGGAAQTLRTTDGGISWSVGVIVGQGLELSGFSALDANHAWMLLVEGEPSNVVRQFHTADGGLSWPELSSGIMSIAPTRDQIRTGACPHPTLSAASLITAYLVNVTPCSPALEFAVTRDGGVTWSRQTLPPSSEQSGPACIIGPAFSSARDGRLVLQAPCPPNGFGGPGHLYGTHDGGISWRPVTLPEPPTRRLLPHGPPLVPVDPPVIAPVTMDDLPFFLDATHGWSWWGAELFRTTDGGATWARLALTGAGSQELGQLHFTSTNDGFAFDNETGKLLKTTDGGQTWRAIPHPLETGE